jgi:t-SNARE complex subunit (syntaxin)
MLQRRRQAYILFCPQARNKEQEAEILQWIEEVTGEKLPSQPYEDVLRDGVILCNLINKIAPGSVKKIQAKGTNFQLMENIQRYCELSKNCYLNNFVERGSCFRRKFLLPLSRNFAYLKETEFLKNVQYSPLF